MKRALTAYFAYTQLKNYEDSMGRFEPPSPRNPSSGCVSAPHGWLWNLVLSGKTNHAVTAARRIQQRILSAEIRLKY